MDEGPTDGIGPDDAPPRPTWAAPAGPPVSSIAPAGLVEPTSPESNVAPGELVASGVSSLPDDTALADDVADRHEPGVLDDAVLGHTVLGDTVLGDTVLGDAVLGETVPLDDTREFDAVGVPARGVDRRVMAACGVVAALLVGGLTVAVSGSGGRIRAELASAADVTVESTRAIPSQTTVPVGVPPTEPSATVAAPAAEVPAVQTTTATTTTTLAPNQVEAPPATAPPLDDEPSVVARPAPIEQPDPPPQAPPAPWANSVFTTVGGHVSTDVGCAPDISAAGLDAFFAARVGPVLGWDYQHVYPLGANRFLWLFQDTFIDHSNTASTLDKASFAHNSALIQEGDCFRLLHRGTTSQPTPFELGTGTQTLRTWFWPMGGELIDGQLHVFWARMRKDAVDPTPPDGLGWHPDATFVATYDPVTLARLEFRQATQGGAAPIYGYAVQTDDEFTYLFANTFEQNLAREGGWLNGPHSGTNMWLGRVPRGQVFDQPEYWTSTGWIRDRRGAEPILQRHWAEFPFQPRIIDGQWVAATAVNGYWGDSFELDVAQNPWGPWTTVESRPVAPRGADPKMNTYHAHLMPWRDAQGQLVVSISNNARNMLRDAWPNPARYRLNIFSAAWRTPPPPTTTTSSTTSSTTTSSTTTSSTTTSTTTSSTTTLPATTTSTVSTSSTAPGTTLPAITTSPTSSSTVPAASSTTSSTTPSSTMPSSTTPTSTSSTTTSSTTTSSTTTSSTTTSSSTPTAPG